MRKLRDMRHCITCNETKSLESFHKNKNKQFGVSGTCKECAIANSRLWYKNNKDKAKDQKLKKAYGIALTDYNAMFTKQNGCCAICTIHQSELKKALAVDHCHLTGEIRGLLCKGCNRGIGYFNDSADKLYAAISYLSPEAPKTGLRVI